MKYFIRLFVGYTWLFITMPIFTQNEIKTTNQDGLVVVKIKLEKGTITVNLPSNIYAGDVISGTVVRESTKVKKKKKEKNLEQLRSYSFTIFGAKILANQNKFSLTVPTNIDIVNSTFRLINKENKLLNTTILPISNLTREPVQMVNLHLPNYFRSGYFQEIKGDFDGDFGNTTALLDGNSVNIVAESLDKIIIAVPENIHGVKTLSIIEDEKNYLIAIPIVDLHLTTDKINLLKGESTNINLTIEGLKKINNPVIISLGNLSPNNISLSGGDQQEIIIEPEMVTEDGMYTSEYPITAKRTGSYSISAQLINPKLGVTPIVAKNDSDSKKCNFIWYDKKWKKIKTITKPDESQKQFIKKTNRRCTVCNKSVVWSYYKIPYFKYSVQEKNKYTCSMKEGHKGFPHHGTSEKIQREVVIGKAFKYKIERIGDCGHKKFVKWTKK